MTKDFSSHHSYQKTALHVSTVSLIWNILLSIAKLFAGLVAHSSAMVSDSVHSASDVLSTIIVMIGVKLSSKKPDKQHPYGHERLECVAAVILSVMLAAVGVGIGYNAAITIINAGQTELTVPGTLALVAALVSIAVKEGLYRYTIHYANEIQSPSLRADAWHHRSDALSSIGSLIGIAGAQLGLPILDPIASIAICVFILKAAVDIFMEAINKMVDHSCDDEVEKQLKTSIKSVPGVVGIDQLRTREFGAKFYVDVEIRVDGKQSLKSAHKIAETVHHKIEKEFPAVKHCMVHENPA